MKNFFYICSIATPEFASLYKKDVLIGAAYKKVISIINSLQSVGITANIISIPPTGAHIKNNIIDKENKQVFIAGSKNKFFSRVRSSINLSKYVLNNIYPGDSVLFYNFRLSFLLCFIVCKIRNIKIVIDIEDYPLENKNLKEFINKIVLKIALNFSDNAIVASNSIARLANLKNSYACYGAVNINKIYNDPFNNEYVNFHYGGSIEKNTGLDLFCETIHALNIKNLPKVLNFFVTGYGDFEKIKELSKEITNENLNLIIMPNCSYSEFNKVFKKIDSSLALKMPENEYADSTFPSKVLEICSGGKLLISTNVSDIPLIFTNKITAVILNNASADELSKAILSVAHKTQKYKQIAEKGKFKVLENYNYSNVGKSLKQELFNEF